MHRTALVIACAVWPLACSATEIFLVCKTDDGKPTFEWALDREAKTLRLVPTKDAMQFEETPTDYSIRIATEGTLLMSIRIDRLTLHYSYFSAWPAPATTQYGSCIALDKPLI